MPSSTRVPRICNSFRQCNLVIIVPILPDSEKNLNRVWYLSISFNHHRVSLTYLPIFPSGFATRFLSILTSKSYSQ